MANCFVNQMAKCFVNQMATSRLYVWLGAESEQMNPAKYISLSRNNFIIFLFSITITIIIKPSIIITNSSPLRQMAELFHSAHNGHICTRSHLLSSPQGYYFIALVQRPTEEIHKYIWWRFHYVHKHLTSASAIPPLLLLG